MIQGLYWFRQGSWRWRSYPQADASNRKLKIKRRRKLRVSSLVAACQPQGTHTLRIWHRLLWETMAAKLWAVRRIMKLPKL